MWYDGPLLLRGNLTFADKSVGAVTQGTIVFVF